jgi:hypothetical protein
MLRNRKQRGSNDSRAMVAFLKETAWGAKCIEHWSRISIRASSTKEHDNRTDGIARSFEMMYTDSANRNTDAASAIKSSVIFGMCGSLFPEGARLRSHNAKHLEYPSQLTEVRYGSHSEARVFRWIQGTSHCP